MNKAILICLGLISLAIAASGQDAKTGPAANEREIMQDLQRKMSSVRSVYLEFTQEKHLKLFEQALLSEGVMLMEKPDFIRWETTSPYQSVLLGDNKAVAQFEKTDGNWKKLKLGFSQLLRRVMEQMSLINQGRLDALTNDFTISISKGEMINLRLVPKDENTRSMMSSLEVRMAPDFSEMREVIMNELGGDFTRIVFHGEMRNVVFPPHTFDQEKPLDIAAVRAGIKHER